MQLACEALNVRGYTLVTQQKNTGRHAGLVNEP
jgi:hypothetical protein